MFFVEYTETYISCVGTLQYTAICVTAFNQGRAWWAVVALVVGGVLTEVGGLGDEGQESESGEGGLGPNGAS